MPVWIRRSLIALAVLGVLLAAALAWLVSSFDPNRYKGVAIDWMKTERQRTLAIDGPIELSVLPRLAVKLSGVRLSETGRADEFLAIDQAVLTVELLPLLKRELVVDRVEARGVRAVLTRDAKGRRNTDDLAGPASPASSAASASAPASNADATTSSPLRFDVSRIDLTDLRLRLKDEPAALDGELRVESLRTGRLADGVESPVELRASFAFKSPAVQGSLSGSTRLLPTLASGSVALRSMDLAFKGDVPGASAVDASLKGSLAWDGAKAALEAQGLAVEVGAKAAGIDFAGSTLAIERFAYDPTRQALSVAKLAVRVKGQRGKDPLALELDWPQLDVQGDKLGGSALSGKVSLAGGTLPVQASFKSGAPTGNFEALSLPGFEATLSSNGAQRQIEGSLRSRIALRPAQRSLTLDALELNAKVTDPGLKPLALSTRGTVSASAQTASWTLNGQLNDNRFDITGNANLSGSTPFIKAQANFDSLDLNSLLSEPGSAAKAGSGGSTAPAPADTPVDMSALRSVNAQIGLRAGNLAFRQYHVGAARVEATLDAGMLRVNTLQGKAWGGTLDATALADARASRIAVKGTASGVNVNALLKDMAAKDLLEGTGRVSLDVDTAGRSVGELRSRLKGNAALQLRDGAVKGINLAKSLRQAKAALSLKQDATQKASQVEKTDFSELTASFQIDNGVARSKDLDLKSPFLRLGGEGAADIGKGTLDYTARATVTGAPTGQDGAELAALKGLTVPVRLTGPFEAIEWKIQWSAVAGDVLRAKAEDKLKEKLGLKPATPAAGGASAPTSPKDVLKEKLLKGLFK